MLYNIKFHKEQIQYSQMMFFQIIYSYITILNLKETSYESPPQTTWYSTVRQEVYRFSHLLDAIRENLISNEISQTVKHDLQRILAWFIIDYFVHSIDLIAQSRKKFRPQSSVDETVIADETDYVWDPDWIHPSFFDITTDI